LPAALRGAFIMLRSILRPLLLLLIASAFMPAHAADISEVPNRPGHPGWRRTLVRYAITFDAQGMSTTVLDFEVLALDQKGAEAISQRVFSYNSYFDELTAAILRP